MFKENDIVHFACTQCGKCCVKTPNMSFEDIMQLSNHFIFQTTHNVEISYATNPLEKLQLEYYQMIGHTIMIPDLDASLFYHINFGVLPLQNSNQCDKLVDNKCSIYMDRPNACRLLPISNNFDEELQWKAVNFFAKKELGWDCDFSTAAPILLKDNQIYSQSYNSIYNIEMQNIRNYTDKYMSFIENFGAEKKNKHFLRLFNTVKVQQQLLTDVIFSLQVGIFYSIITIEDANLFMSNQIVLLKQALTNCLEKKDKSNAQGQGRISEPMPSNLNSEQKQIAKMNNLASILTMHAAIVGYGQACNFNAENIQRIETYFISEYKIKDEPLIMAKYREKISEFKGKAPTVDECRIFFKEFSLVLNEITK